MKNESVYIPAQKARYEVQVKSQDGPSKNQQTII